MKVYIWGTGESTKQLMDEKALRVEVEGYIETIPTNDMFNGKKIFSASEQFEYDAIIISSIYVHDIWKVIMREKYDPNKLIFMNYLHEMQEYDNSCLARQVLSELGYNRYVCEYKLYEKSFFAEDRKKYSELNTRENFAVKKEYEWPIIEDKYDNAGTVNSYFWQDLWAAKLIAQNRPVEHFDIGSRLDGFLAHIIAMRIPLKVIDVRPFPIPIEGLRTIVEDATNLTQIEDASICSLSALCSLEHFGLGRYGDPVDPEACFKCFSSIQEKMCAGGDIYISVPIGRERLQFNAHRIFYARTILECFDKCNLIEFSTCCNDCIEYNTNICKYDEEDKYIGRFGLFHFKKK